MLNRKAIDLISYKKEQKSNKLNVTVLKEQKSNKLNVTVLHVLCRFVSFIIIIIIIN